MMTRKLILIEGLPGSGKSTVAKMVSEILIEQGKKVQLFQEGNLEHLADYEGVSFYYAGDFEALLKTHEKYIEVLESNATAHDQGFLIPYRKMKEQWGIELPDHIVKDIFSRDIYEIPFEQNVKLITEKWQDSTQNVLSTNDDCITIFECCFIQNPLTMGLVKCNQSKEQNVQYVLELGRIIHALNPLLIYIDQKDISYTFDKAVSERPKDGLKVLLTTIRIRVWGKQRVIRVLRVRYGFCRKERSWSPKSMGYFNWIRYGWIIRIMTARLVGTS
ncbi:adenylyl-sulfate kinase [Paenibacillus polymyxa]|uniref:adenylyl-sulfate kinase n=1 Tax=Paenibacillus polymyxa TaxID=1406 RepID=UPI0020352CBE|nr:adenylyl-sulfate kinase [Paenibacillus polymyxa]